jgi:hypothetical protein
MDFARGPDCDSANAEIILYLFGCAKRALARAGSPLPAVHAIPEDGGHGVTRPTNESDIMPMFAAAHHCTRFPVRSAGVANKTTATEAKRAPRLLTEPSFWLGDYRVIVTARKTLKRSSRRTSD